jgi:hypothetical protein
VSFIIWRNKTPVYRWISANAAQPSWVYECGNFRSLPSFAAVGSNGGCLQAGRSHANGAWVLADASLDSQPVTPTPHFAIALSFSRMAFEMNLK